MMELLPVGTIGKYQGCDGYIINTNICAADDYAAI
jgi:hypothetical protein